MRVASIALVAAVLVGSASIPATAVSGGLPFPQASARVLPTPRRSQPRNPWANLFTGQLKVDPTRPSPPKASLLGQRPAQRPAQAFRVLCGMTLIPADPKIDAGIRHPVPENGPKFSIQTFPPPACQQ